jgi:hypothetical protein
MNPANRLHETRGRPDDDVIAEAAVQAYASELLLAAVDWT